MSNSNDPIVLVLGGDDNYALPMAVTLHSALVHCTTDLPVIVYILDGGISLANKQRLNHLATHAGPPVEMHWRSVTPASVPHSTHTASWLNDTAFLRLHIPDVLPLHHTRALYLDSDLVVQSNLGDLWITPFDGAAILAAQDAGVPYVSDHRGLASYRALGLSPTAPYFNSGVMAMDLTRWRTERISEQVMNYLDAHAHENHFGDQDGLNAVLAHDWKPLSAAWNVPHFIQAPYWTQNACAWADSGFLHEIRALRSHLPEAAHIIHYAGADKPWDRASHYPLQWPWYQALWKSGWYPPAEEAKSRLAFYTRYAAERLLINPVRLGTRPLRHLLATRLAAPPRRSELS